MIKLYDSALSPFARKVRMVLEHKGLNFEAVDGLLKSNHDLLKAVNGRIEVPVLADGDIIVVNSADIVSYLEFRYPEEPVYPEAPAARVHARAWERAADTFIDAILIDVSYWKWADRHDSMPDGLLEAARADLWLVYDALESGLADREFVSGTLSIADIALFPHLASANAMEVEFSAQDPRYASTASSRRATGNGPEAVTGLPRASLTSIVPPRLACRPILLPKVGRAKRRHHAVRPHSSTTCASRQSKRASTWPYCRSCRRD